MHSTSRPAPFWVPNEVQFGQRPDAPLVPVWSTTRLRVCVIGQRRRQIITDENRRSYFYPLWTRREERVPGKFKSHTQIAVVFPGDDTLHMISLKGYSKTICWDNELGSRFYNDGFPPGAWHMLKDYAASASKQKGKKIPPLCTWWLDLVPYFETPSKPNFVDVGNGVFMLPFIADLATAPSHEQLPRTRFVGMDAFQRFQELRRDVVLEWERQWHLAERMAREGVSSPIIEDEYEQIDF